MKYSLTNIQSPGHFLQTRTREVKAIKIFSFPGNPSWYHLMKPDSDGQKHNILHIAIL